MASTCPISSGVPSFAGRLGYPSTVEAVEAAKRAALNRDAAWANAAAYPMGVESNIYNRMANTAYPMGLESTFGMPSMYSHLGGVSPMSNTFGGVPVNNWTAGYPTVHDRFGGMNTFGLPWAADMMTRRGVLSGVPSTLERFGGYPSGSEFFGRNFEDINDTLCSISARPSSRIESYTLSNPIRVLDREGHRMVWLCIELKGYKPEEINVTLNKAERAIIIEAAHETKDGKEHHVIRKFNRKFVLPESLSKVDLAKVELKSCLNVEGLLSVEIELPKMTAEEIAKCPTTSRLINELSYGAFGPMGVESTFGMPSIYNRLGGVHANTWSANMTFGGMPSTLERFAGFPSGSEFFGRNVDSIGNSLYNIASRPSSRIESHTLSNPIRVLDGQGNRMVWLCFDLKGYKSEEINVTLSKAERAVIVEAAHEAKDGKEHHVTRKFYRKFVLPESLSKIDLTKVELKSSLNGEGLLSVEIELPKMTVEEIAKCPTTSRLINELSFGAGYGYPSTFGGYGVPSGFAGLTYGSHGINNAWNSCHDNVKPVTVKTA